jgi:sugar/nucleoside kinase (ribokinase family)
MTDATHDVIAIGNALVDVIAEVDDAFIAAQGLTHGAMTLIDAGRADALYAAMPPAVERSGGSAGNTVVGVASLGGRASYIGKVADDQLGGVFRHDIRAAGVTYEIPPSTKGAPTGRCLIVVTPDAQRTMSTFLGAGTDLGPEDVSVEAIERAQVVFLEGYLWDPPRAKEAFLKATKIAKGAGRKVSLTLSDAFCVERFRDEFRDLVANHVDILFANESEIISLYQVENFDAAAAIVRKECDVVALTRSEKGSMVIAGNETHTIAAVPTRVVDTTGAGDMYAAGFLYGYTHGLGLERSGEIAAICAAEVISHFGPRPEVRLATLI